LLSKILKIKVYRTISFPIVLYGCESWLLTLREECSMRVFENRGLRIIFRPKRDEREWRKLHNEELNDLYCSPNTVHVIKLRMRWPGHAARMGGGEEYTGLWWGNLRVKDHFEDPGPDGITLRWIFRKWDVGVWTGSSWLKVGTGGGHL
jgi:hypothetical protein